MRPDCTILISSAGRRVELIGCFRDSAAALGIGLRVLATDLDPSMSAACQVADRGLPVPCCTSPEFPDYLLEICRAQRVDLVVPTIDTELVALSASRERFRAAGTEIAISAPEVVALCRDKLRTAWFLATQGIPTPRSGTLDEVRAAPSRWRWPLIIRPRGGSSSNGLRILAYPDELAALALPADDFAQELARGQEYTVNLFFDRAGGLRCAIPHRRCAVRAGEVAKGVTGRQERLEQVAWTLGRSLAGARGALCCQAIVDDAGEPVVFEINARFGGGYPLAHRAGAVFCRWLLEETLGLPVSADNDWQAGVLMLRHDQSVFLEPGARP
jgi:carbamoyl-phosphate synthase large subunit